VTTARGPKRATDSEKGERDAPRISVPNDIWEDFMTYSLTRVALLATSLLTATAAWAGPEIVSGPGA
jgi:hypothetical protein